MTNPSPILRYGYPPVILRAGEDIILSQNNESVVLRSEEIKVANQLGAGILKTRSDIQVKITQSNLILRTSDVGSHIHDNRYYTKAITDTLLDLKVSISDIVNNLTTDDDEKALSAAQGVVLKGLIDQINTLLTSNDVSLDQLQEIVNYIKENRADIDSLGISSIIGLQTALDGKVPNTRTLTINGVTYDLSANRSYTIATTAPSGSNGNIQRAKDGAFYGTEFLDFDETTGDVTAHKNLGTEKVANGAFTGSASSWTTTTGWAYSSNRIGHTANGTGTLSQNISCVIGELYKVTFEIQDLTVGSVTVTLGGITLGTYSANGVYTAKIRATSTASLVFTPTNTSRLYIDNVSVKKYQDGSISTGKGYFSDKLKVSISANNYYPGTTDHVELENPTGGYTHITGKFGSTIKQTLSMSSGGEIYANMTSTTGFILQYGSTITSTSPFAYLGSSGMYYYGYGRFSGDVVAGYTGSFNAKLSVNGGRMERYRYVNDNNYVLDQDVLYVLDPTGKAGCYGTPTTSCGSLGTQGACDAKSYLGCGWVITDYCSNYSNEYLYNCNFGPCSPTTAVCSAGDESTCTGLNTWGGNCAWNYYSTSCDSFGEEACNSNPGCSPNTSQCSTNYFNCAQYGNATDCNNASGNGCLATFYDYCNAYGETDCGNDGNCTKNYFNCAQYNGDETGCNDHSGDGCSYDGGICSGGNFTNCTGNFNSCTGGNFVDCTGGAPCSGLSEGACSMTYYFTSCSGETSYYQCDGNYNTGECGGGSIGTCGGTASCNGIASESPCNAEDGCSYQTAMTTLLPNSNTFHVAISVGLTNYAAMSKVYEAVVVGSGSINLTTQGSDTFETGGTTKSLSTNKRYLLRFIVLPGNCTDFNANESGCTTTSGCSPSYDESSVFNGCSGVYQKYKKWYVFTTD